jgi:DNA-binding MarR family transcriptional regulator
MLALWQHSSVSVTELGRLLQLDSGTLSPLLKRLEAGGLVRRERAGDDERRVTVSVTPRGRELRSDAERIPGAVVERLGIDIADLRALHGSLTRVIAAATATG